MRLETEQKRSRMDLPPSAQCEHRSADNTAHYADVSGKKLLDLHGNDPKSELSCKLHVVANVARRFRLTSLQSSLMACESLARDDSPLDVAVLGQFKSGKSSLLNALLGENVFPIGAVPVTAVITRAMIGQSRSARVTHLDGAIEEVGLDRLSDFVTEAGNPANGRQVAVVDVLLPAMCNWPGMRLVDTPGLGSVFAHNTHATRAWMPNVAVALVTVSADRPLSDDDLRLLDEARQTAPRVVVMLTKVDLLTNAGLQEVTAFLDRALRESFGGAIPVLPFSCRVETERWVRQLQENVLLPVAKDVARARRAALKLKLAALVRSCRGYLEIGLEVAERADADRQRLREAVLNESVSAAVIHDELRLAEQSVRDKTRPQFESMFRAQRTNVNQRVTEALSADLPTWRGNLAQHTERYDAWMADRLTNELTPLSQEAASLAIDLLAQAEGRFRRIVEAFRDRLSRNVQNAAGVRVSPIAWEARRPQLAVVPVAVSRAFMTHWDLLWWMLPMWLVGGLFRRHILGRVAWEVEKNLTRLAGDWAEVVGSAVADLRRQAADWVDGELATLDALLGNGPTEAVAFREALRQLEEADTAREGCQPSNPLGG